MDVSVSWGWPGGCLGVLGVAGWMCWCFGGVLRLLHHVKTLIHTNTVILTKRLYTFLFQQKSMYIHRQGQERPELPSLEYDPPAPPSAARVQPPGPQYTKTSRHMLP